MKLCLRADDRVLLLAIPATANMAAMARILMHGVLVAIGPPEQVDSTREALADFDNVLLLNADHQRIPWRDAYFSKIVAPEGVEQSSEWTRLLAPGGEIIRSDYT